MSLMSVMLYMILTILIKESKMPRVLLSYLAFKKENNMTSNITTYDPHHFRTLSVGLITFFIHSLIMYQLPIIHHTILSNTMMKISPLNWLWRDLRKMILKLKQRRIGFLFV